MDKHEIMQKKNINKSDISLKKLFQTMYIDHIIDLKPLNIDSILGI